MMREWPVSRNLRRWQEAAFQKYLEHALGKAQANFLLSAVPGSGKTLFTLRVILELLVLRIIKRVVIVVPTEYLKKQWADAAAQVGIKLDPYWKNGTSAVAADMDGIVVTYAQVASQPDLHRLLCKDETLCVLDEVHHCGETKSWGDGIRDGYGAALKRLLLSGTPWRKGPDPIPFVTYVDGVSVPDFNYSYADALSDGICRSVFFPSYEGDMEWYYKGETFKKTFAEKLNDQKANHRLRTALDAKTGQWLPEVIRDADAKITELRTMDPEFGGQRDAGGLIVAMNIDHANEIAAIVRLVTGHAPTVVTIEELKALEMIEEFAKSNRRWIVAIKMVSEGVDIPRLQVLVYASNILTEMFFRQVLGRILRGTTEENAYFFLPKDERLIGYAEKIKEERNHALTQEAEEIGPGPGGNGTPSVFVPISSTGRPDDVIVDKDKITQEEITRARDLKTRFRSQDDPAKLAQMVRLIEEEARRVQAGPAVATGATVVLSKVETPLYEKKKKLERIHKRLASRIKARSGDTLSHEDIYGELKKSDGVSQPEATLEQLQERTKYLETWLTRLCNGG